MSAAVYQGVEGAYSQLAIAHFLTAAGSDAELFGVSTYREMATRLAGLRADVGIVPIENAIAGTVREGYDLLAEFDLAPVEELQWRTDHRLLGIAGAELPGVREVLAHPLTIAECGRFLAGLENAHAIPCEDTGVAAREVARRGNPEIAALAPAAAGRIYGLSEIAVHCTDDPHTYTRFLIVASRQAVAAGRVAPSAGAGPRKTALIFGVEDRAGALAGVLEILARREIDGDKLESKPALGRGGERTFYVEFAGDVADRNVAAAIDEFGPRCRWVTVLGSYRAHSGAPIDADVAPLPALRAAPSKRSTHFPPPPAPTAFPRVARAAKPEGTVLQIGGIRIEDGSFVIAAGPCSVESREQILATARGVRAGGPTMLRGGAFKPRTSPYAFQGLGWEGVALLAEAGRATGLPTISEVMTIDQVEPMAARIDVLQIGARNMQNFDLLKAVGRAGCPVLLKRGFSATIDELLAAAEYVLAEGTPTSFCANGESARSSLRPAIRLICPPCRCCASARTYRSSSTPVTPWGCAVGSHRYAGQPKQSEPKACWWKFIPTPRKPKATRIKP